MPNQQLSKADKLQAINPLEANYVFLVTKPLLVDYYSGIFHFFHASSIEALISSASLSLIFHKPAKSEILTPLFPLTNPDH
jgi:hypothetical protein